MTKTKNIKKIRPTKRLSPYASPLRGSKHGQPGGTQVVPVISHIPRLVSFTGISFWPIPYTYLLNPLCLIEPPSAAVVSRDLKKSSRARVEANRPSNPPMAIVEVGKDNRGQTSVTNPRLVRCVQSSFIPLTALNGVCIEKTQTHKYTRRRHIGAPISQHAYLSLRTSKSIMQHI